MKLTKLTLCMVALLTVACSKSKETQTQTQTQAQTESEAESEMNGMALEYYQKAKNGDAIAQYELAKCYYIGHDVSKSNVKAMEWAKKSAEQGCPQGSQLVGTMYEGDNGSTDNKAEANKWYSQAFKQATPLAENGDARAQYVLYCLYNEGNGVAKDQQEAIRLLKLSAENGYLDAQITLGDYYEKSNNLSEAVKWRKKAAEQIHERDLKVVERKIKSKEDEKYFINEVSSPSADSD